MKNKLTEKCEESFRIWFDENYNDYWTYYHTKPIIINAIIIEWFDSMGIWKNTFNNFYVKYFRNEMTLTEATNAAIEKANEIFNLNNK